MTAVALRALFALACAAAWWLAWPRRERGAPAATAGRATALVIGTLVAALAAVAADPLGDALRRVDGDALGAFCTR